VFIAQEKVFRDLGHGMLDNAWQGYNCSLFAYGQTGSGKSYSVMGNDANRGDLSYAINCFLSAVNGLN